MQAKALPGLTPAAYSSAGKGYRKRNQEKYAPKPQWMDTWTAREKKHHHWCA